MERSASAMRRQSAMHHHAARPGTWSERRFKSYESQRPRSGGAREPMAATRLQTIRGLSSDSANRPMRPPFASPGRMAPWKSGRIWPSIGGPCWHKAGDTHHDRATHQGRWRARRVRVRGYCVHLTGEQALSASVEGVRYSARTAAWPGSGSGRTAGPLRHGSAGAPPDGGALLVTANAGFKSRRDTRRAGGRQRAAAAEY